MLFDLHCRRCPRLASHLDAVRTEFPQYHAKPVPAFGADDARLLIVGLAPGMHGANRTGRPFTGDHAGILLYASLFKFGFATAPISESAADGLNLIDCRITNAVKCLPPDNKPIGEEIEFCNSYLSDEIKAFSNLQAVLALGAIAHQAVLKALQLKVRDFPFSHGKAHHLPHSLMLFDSYHCSRYNTQTRRLTGDMFHAVFRAIRDRIGAAST